MTKTIACDMSVFFFDSLQSGTNGRCGFALRVGLWKRQWALAKGSWRTRAAISPLAAKNTFLEDVMERRPLSSRRSHFIESFDIWQHGAPDILGCALRKWADQRVHMGVLEATPCLVLKEFQPGNN